MKRVFLFIATNIAIIFVLSIVLRVLGVDLGSKGGASVAAG